MALSGVALAAPYVPVANPVSPAPGNNVPAPNVVPGKEYSTYPDRDANGQLAPGQVLLWDGSGGVMNGPLVFIPQLDGPTEIDALGYNGDALFDEVKANQSSLIISVGYDGRTPQFSEPAVNDPPVNLPRLWFEQPDGTRGVWATSQQVDLNFSTEFTQDWGDVDGVELWGPEGVSDLSHVSIQGDAARYSIYAIDGSGVVLKSEMAAAVGISEDDPDYWQFDVDALMLKNIFVDPANGGVSGEVIFSIRPILVETDSGLEVLYDGGEIWTYTLGSFAPADFLDHGGHLWDTKFDVRTAFNVDNENVDAIEAVSTDIPEPGTIAGGLAVAGLVAFRWYRARRRA